MIWVCFNFHGKLSVAFLLQWLKERSIEHLLWPPYSVDLNPIENLWKVLVRIVYEGGRQFQIIEEVKFAVLRYWEVIDKRTLKNLVNSMSHKIYQVINNHGCSIAY